MGLRKMWMVTVTTTSARHSNTQILSVNATATPTTDDTEGEKQCIELPRPFSWLNERGSVALLASHHRCIAGSRKEKTVRLLVRSLFGFEL